MPAQNYADLFLQTLGDRAHGTRGGRTRHQHLPRGANRVDRNTWRNYEYATRMIPEPDIEGPVVLHADS
jgi:hypothetical protein